MRSKLKITSDWVTRGNKHNQKFIIFDINVSITTTQLHLTNPELRFCAGSNPARGVSEIRDGEDLWQWFRLEIRLNAFRRSTIPQKQFIITTAENKAISKHGVTVLKIYSKYLFAKTLLKVHQNFINDQSPRENWTEEYIGPKSRLWKFKKLLLFCLFVYYYLQLKILPWKLQGQITIFKNGHDCLLNDFM